MKKSLIHLSLAASLLLPMQLPAMAARTHHHGEISHPRIEPIIEHSPSGSKLGRVTAYWPGEVNGDYYTDHLMSATGVTLQEGQCAVDPRVIPYGSVVEVPGVGRFLAVDTGSAVVSRKAAREAAHTSDEKKALVVDLFFRSPEAGEEFAASTSDYSVVSWEPPLLSSMLITNPDLAASSGMLRPGPAIQPIRPPDEADLSSSLLRLGTPNDPLRPQVEPAPPKKEVALKGIKVKPTTRTASHHPVRKHHHKYIEIAQDR